MGLGHGPCFAFRIKVTMKKLYALLLALPIAASALAQPGTLDATFDPLGGPNDWVNCMVEQPDGKILIGGDFTSYNGVPRNRIARINADGTLDATFDPGQGASSTVTTIALQADGKVLVGGWFSTFNGATHYRLVRLNADGSVDGSLATGNGFVAQVEQVMAMPDGRILVAGGFWMYNGQTANRVVMLTSTGSIDAGFNVGSGFTNNDVKRIALMPDGRIAVAGGFTIWNDVPANGLVMLESDGSLSNTLTAFTGTTGAIRALLPMPNGGLLIGGEFAEVNGVSWLRLARLQANGALDPQWGSPSGTFSTVRGLLRQADGRIVVVGSFNTLFGAPRVRVARLLPGGAIETAFDPGNGPNLDVECALLVGGDRILIGGNFTSYDGTPRARLARIKACLPTPVTIDGTTLTASAPSGPYQWINCSTGQPITGATSQSFTPTANGSYAVTTTSNGCAITSDCINVTTVGVVEWSEPDFRIWPNPSAGTMRVSCPEGGMLELLSLDGRALLQQRTVTGEHVLDAGTAADGTYLLRYRGQEGILVRTIVIQR